MNERKPIGRNEGGQRSFRLLRGGSVGLKHTAQGEQGILTCLSQLTREKYEIRQDIFLSSILPPTVLEFLEMEQCQWDNKNLHFRFEYGVATGKAIAVTQCA